jgi:hypothetical protein
MRLAEIGQPERRRVLIPDELPTPVEPVVRPVKPPQHEPAKVPEQEPA